MGRITISRRNAIPTYTDQYGEEKNAKSPSKTISENAPFERKSPFPGMQYPRKRKGLGRANQSRITGSNSAPVDNREITILFQPMLALGNLITYPLHPPKCPAYINSILACAPGIERAPETDKLITCNRGVYGLRIR